MMWRTCEDGRFPTRKKKSMVLYTCQQERAKIARVTKWEVAFRTHASRSVVTLLYSCCTPFCSVPCWWCFTARNWSGWAFGSSRSFFLSDGTLLTMKRLSRRRRNIVNNMQRAERDCVEIMNLKISSIRNLKWWYYTYIRKTPTERESHVLRTHLSRTHRSQEPFYC